MCFPRPPVAIFIAAIAFTCPACKTTPETGKIDKANLQPKNKTNDLVSTARNDDVSFQAFVSRLRQAVKAHDVEEIASMMTADFGYQLEPELSGKGVFEYWDRNNVWPELALVLNETFVINNVGGHDNYMVAPAEFVVNPESYSGYRAGIVLLNGSWKFAYFVSGKSETDITPE